MAGVGWKLTTPVGGVATGTALKTILQAVAAANHALLVNEWSIAFAGVSNTGTPIEVTLRRQTTAGTTSAQTPVSDPDDQDETLQVTGRHTATVEPTSTDILDTQYVHPQTGYTWQAPFGKMIKVGGGDRLGILVNAGADVQCMATFKGEE